MNRQSSNNNRRVRWRWLLRWKNALNHDYKNNNGRNFQFTKFSFIDFVLTDRRSLSGKRPKSASGKSSSCRFSFSAARNLNTKATEYVTSVFLFVYWFFSPSKQILKSCNNTREKKRYFFTCVWYHQSAADTSLAFRATRSSWWMKSKAFHSQSKVVCRNFFGLWLLKHWKIRIALRLWLSNVPSRGGKPK